MKIMGFLAQLSPYATSTWIAPLLSMVFLLEFLKNVS